MTSSDAKEICGFLTPQDWIGDKKPEYSGPDSRNEDYSDDEDDAQVDPGAAMQAGQSLHAKYDVMNNLYAAERQNHKFPIEQNHYQIPNYKQAPDEVFERNLNKGRKEPDGEVETNIRQDHPLPNLAQKSGPSENAHQRMAKELAKQKGQENHK